MAKKRRKAKLKVVPFKPARSMSHEDCVGLFTRQLGRMDKESVVAAAFVVVHSDGAVGTAYVSDNDAFTLLGGVANLGHRIQTEAIDGS